MILFFCCFYFDGLTIEKTIIEHICNMWSSLGKLQINKINCTVFNPEFIQQREKYTRDPSSINKLRKPFKQIKNGLPGYFLQLVGHFVWRCWDPLKEISQCLIKHQYLVEHYQICHNWWDESFSGNLRKHATGTTVVLVYPLIQDLLIADTRTASLTWLLWLGACQTKFGRSILYDNH